MEPQLHKVLEESLMLMCLSKLFKPKPSVAVDCYALYMLYTVIS